MMKNYGNNIVFSELTDDSGGGGGGAADIVVDPTTVSTDPAPAAAPTAFSLPDNWRDTLPDDLKSEPSLGPIADFHGLVKSYVHSQKAIGADKFVIPGKHATDDDWGAVFRKLGNPEKLEDYEVKVPDGADFQDGFITEIKKIGHAQGILPKQMDALLGWYNQANNEALAAQEKTVASQVEEQIGTLKREWGEAYQKNLNNARNVIKAHGDEGLYTFLEESGFGNNPDLIKFLSKIGGSMFTEDNMGALDPNAGTMTPEAIQGDINKILNDSSHPYFNADHPNHLAAVKEVEKLFQRAHPNSQEQSLV